MWLFEVTLFIVSITANFLVFELTKEYILIILFYKNTKELFSLLFVLTIGTVHQAETAASSGLLLLRRN